MQRSDFKSYTKNKMFIAIYGKKDKDIEMIQKEWNELSNIYTEIRDAIFGEWSNFVDLDVYHYEFATINIRYDKILKMYDCDITAEKKRRSFRVGLEKKFIKLKNELENRLEFLNLDWFGLVFTHNNNECVYTKFNEWKEEI